MLRSIVLVSVVLALANAAVFDPFSRRYGVCKSTISTLLTVPSGSSHCNWVTGMMALSVKANLTSSQNTAWTTMINTVETTVINNASISNQTDKLNAMANAMQTFSMDTSASNGSAIYQSMKYMNISTWGPMDMMVQISTEWNMQSSITLVVASDVHGNCPLFDSLLAACTDSTKKAALQAFINSDLKKIVANSSSETDCIQQIQLSLNTKFFVGAQASWKSYFGGLKIGKISFLQFSACADSYTKTTASSSVFAGSNTTCPFILALNASLSFTNLTVSQKGFIKQLITYFQAQWSTTVTVSDRMNLCSMKFSESCDLSPANFGLLSAIPIPGFGCFWDLITVSCQINIMPTSCGCVKPVFEMTTEMPTTMMPATMMPHYTTPKCHCTCDM